MRRRIRNDEEEDAIYCNGGRYGCRFNRVYQDKNGVIHRREW